MGHRHEDPPRARRAVAARARRDDRARRHGPRRRPGAVRRPHAARADPRHQPRAARGHDHLSSREPRRGSPRGTDGGLRRGPGHHVAWRFHRLAHRGTGPAADRRRHAGAERHARPRRHQGIPPDVRPEPDRRGERHRLRRVSRAHRPAQRRRAGWLDRYATRAPRAPTRRAGRTGVVGRVRCPDRAGPPRAPRRSGVRSGHRTRRRAHAAGCGAAGGRRVRRRPYRGRPGRGARRRGPVDPHGRRIRTQLGGSGRAR